MTVSDNFKVFTTLWAEKLDDDQLKYSLRIISEEWIRRIAAYASEVTDVEKEEEAEAADASGVEGD